MRVFLDNNIPVGLARSFKALMAGHCDVTHISEVDELGESADDIEWIRWLQKENQRGGDWVVITSDIRTRNRPKERRALAESGLTVFWAFRGMSGLKPVRQMEHLCRWWDGIREAVDQHAPGTLFELSDKARKPAVWNPPWL